MAVLALGSAAVDDSNEVSGDDDAVLVFLLWVLGDAVLLDNLHVWVFLYLCTRRNTDAVPVSRFVCGRYRQVPACRGRSPCRTSRWQRSWVSV